MDRHAVCPNPNCSVKTVQPVSDAEGLEKDALAEGEGNIQFTCLLGQSGDELAGTCALINE